MRANPGEQFVAFGEFRFDQRSAILSKRGIRIRVPGQSLAVLAALLENPGETVSREELRLLLWPNGTHVEFEQGLNSVLKRLRAALADSHTAPGYIETLPKRGYRFICPLEQSSAKAEPLRFRAGYSNQQLIAYLFLPKQRRPPYQCVVFVPSGDAFQAKPGDAIQPEEYILRSGRAMMYPIFWGTYDRFVTMPPDPANAGYPSPMFIREGLIAWKKELGRSIDYLQTRKDIGHIGYLAASSGAEFAPVLLAEERRVKAAVLLSGGMPAPHMRLMPESDSANFASRVTIPVLMLNGRYDSVLPLEVQDSMFRLLGTPEANKAHILVESGHGVFAPEVAHKTVHETLAWLDRYLGSP